jgi:hypothetical protein
LTNQAWIELNFSLICCDNVVGRHADYTVSKAKKKAGTSGKGLWPSKSSVMPKQWSGHAERKGREFFGHRRVAWRESHLLHYTYT